MTDYLIHDPQQYAIADQQMRIRYQQVQEIYEAQVAGEAALRQAKEVDRLLGKAKGWGTWDLLGGGIIATMIKHSCLDDAQEASEKLSVLLQRFRSELADVHIDSRFQNINIDGLLRFSDYVFGGIFTDFIVLDHIEEVQEHLGQIKTQLSYALSQLAAIRSVIEGEIAYFRQQMGI